MINWKVRLKSPAFWTGLIGVLGAFAVGMAQLFGVDITAEAGSWQQALTALVTAVFGVLALVGVTTDPTTKGLGDSAQALTYTSQRTTGRAEYARKRLPYQWGKLCVHRPRGGTGAGVRGTEAA